MGKDLNGKKLPTGITQRKNGAYMGRVMFNGITHTLYDNSLTELKKSMNDLRYELEHGSFTPANRLTFGEFYDEWLETYKADTIKKPTYDRYKSEKRYYKSFENVKLADIRASHIKKALDDLVEDGKASGTIKNVYMTVHNVFKYAVKLRLIQYDPCEQILSIPKAKKESRKAVALTKEQQDIFLKYCDTSYLGDMFKLCLQTGMRGGELGALRWSDVDLKERVIHVTHTLTNDGTLGTPKTKTSYRTIPMTDTAVEILKRMRGNVIRLGDDFVFHSPYGNPVYASTRASEINRIKSRIIEEYPDFPKEFTCHSLRHTFATRCSEAGMDMNTLKTILGHSSLAMTADLYSHVLEDQKKIEMDKIQEAL